MKSAVSRRNILLASLAGLVVLLAAIYSYFILHDGKGETLQSPASSITTPSPVSDRRPGTPSVEPTPGLIIYGVVRDRSGAGVADVLIYRNYASYPGEVIATTDSNGSYETDFYRIPGDEMVGVWAEKSGFGFDPPYCSWRHYYGFEQRECNFLAEQP